MDPIWKAHWPLGLDESRIVLPQRPLPAMLKDSARRFGPKPALIFYGRGVSFAELDEASDRFAGWLRGRGLRPGDRVAILLENCPQFAIATHCNPPHRPRYGTVGLPLPFTEARIVSLEDGVTELPVGETGEIVVRGPMVMKGYWGRPDATAEVLRDGWFWTGDIGAVDGEGYFSISERKKDMIEASGYSVFPAEVEAIMYRHPAIAEVGVVGVSDPYRGEDVLAWVVLRPGAAATEREIVQWCRGQMAVYKAPRAVRFVPALPRTGSGKILKRALREQARAGA